MTQNLKKKVKAKRVSLVKKTNLIPDDIQLDKVKEAIDALKTASSSSKNLFNDLPTRLQLDIKCFITPEGKNHFYNIVLPYSPYYNPDILLIIPDEKGEELTIDRELRSQAAKDALLTEGIKIREVLTLRQLRDDYSTFEAKRALANRIDLILAANSIFKNLSSILGREVYKKKKFPLRVKFTEKSSEDSNLPIFEFDREEFEHTIRKTVFNISLNGPTSSIIIGNDQQSSEELTQNVSKICHWIMKHFPGGWENVEKLSVHLSPISPLIIYLSPGTKDDVVREPRTRGGKIRETVEDELSTMPGYRVRVHGGGEIELLSDDELSDAETCAKLDVKEEWKFDRKFHFLERKQKREEAEKKKEKARSGLKRKRDFEDAYVEDNQKKEEFEEQEKKKTKKEGKGKGHAKGITQKVESTKISKKRFQGKVDAHEVTQKAENIKINKKKKIEDKAAADEVNQEAQNIKIREKKKSQAQIGNEPKITSKKLTKVNENKKGNSVVDDNNSKKVKKNEMISKKINESLEGKGNNVGRLKMKLEKQAKRLGEKIGKKDEGKIMKNNKNVPKTSYGTSKKNKA